MAFTNITLKRGSETVHAPVGFSFTTFFFGLFPALFRGDFAAAGLFLLMGILMWIPLIGLIALVAWIFVPAIYNRSFIARKLDQGFEMNPQDEESLAFHQLHQKQIFPLRGNEKQHVIIYAAVAVVGFIVLTGIFSLFMVIADL